MQLGMENCPENMAKFEKSIVLSNICEILKKKYRIIRKNFSEILKIFEKLG